MCDDRRLQRIKAAATVHVSFHLELLALDDFDWEEIQVAVQSCHAPSIQILHNSRTLYAFCFVLRRSGLISFQFSLFFHFQKCCFRSLETTAQTHKEILFYSVVPLRRVERTLNAVRSLHWHTHTHIHSQLVACTHKCKISMTLELEFYYFYYYVRVRLNVKCVWQCRLQSHGSRCIVVTHWVECKIT